METMYSRLKTWRWNLARELNLPPFFILSNAHLAGVAAARPATLDELAACKGFGPKKLAQFGEALLAQVAACVAEGLEPGVELLPPPLTPVLEEPLSEAAVAEIMAGLRRQLALQVARRFKGRYSAEQVEAVLLRLAITA
jgi:ribonuclease D